MLVTASVSTVFILLGFLFLWLILHHHSPRKAATLFMETLEDRAVPTAGIQAIKARIATEFPAVANPNTPDVVRVDLLRTWAYQNVDIGDASLGLDRHANSAYYKRSLPQLLDLFDRDVGTVGGSGTAYFLQKLYQAYNFSTGRISIGIANMASYPLTLVQVQIGQGATTTLIQDGYTDRTVVDADGKPLDAKTVARLARLGRAEEVHWRGGQNTGRDLLVTARDQSIARTGPSWAVPLTSTAEVDEIRPGVWKMRGEISVDNLMSQWWERRMAPAMARQEPDLPRVFASSFAFPIWVTGSAGLVFAASLPEDTLRRPPVMSLQAIKARIAAEFPEVADRKTSDVVRVNLLRTWAFQTIDIGTASFSLDARPESDYEDRSLAELVALFDRDAGTVMCGGAAHFLVKLYEAYGYTAGRISVGFQDLANHTVTLVQVKTSGGNTKLLIQDAYTDRTVVDRNGEPMDARRVARLARLGRANEIHWQEGHNTGRNLLVSSHGKEMHLQGDSWAFDPRTDSDEAEVVRPGMWKLQGSSRGDRMVNVWWLPRGPELLAARNPTLPRVFNSTFAYPLWAVGPAGDLFVASLPPGNLRGGEA